MPRIERKEIPPTPVPPKVEYVITLTEEEAKSFRAYLRDKQSHGVASVIYCSLPS